MHIYVASSWRNTYYSEVVAALRDAGHEVYDFRNPPTGNPGFHWTDVDINCMDWTPAEYQANLSHPLAERQFKNDIEAMTACDACVLVLPCGRSAHTEAGWFAGQGKKVYAFIPDKDSFEPEPMYKLFTKSLPDLYDEVTMPPELRRAHQENDRAVMAAYGFSTKMTESECVAELFKKYQELTK